MKPAKKKTEQTKPNAAVASNANGSPAVRRRWLFRLAAMTVVPVVLLLVAELGLRIVGFGYNPHFFKELTIQGQPFLVQNEDFSRRFFPPETLRHPGALRMHAMKPAGSVRIFILGESAAMGDPEPTYGPSRYLEALLWQRHPNIDFEVVNVAFTAINSHVVLPIARECAEHEGDVWIIYMGNNEMVGPFGAVTVFGMQSPPRMLVRLSLAAQRSRVGQACMALSRRFRKPATDQAAWGGMGMFLNNRVGPDSPKREVVYRNFEENLEAMLQSATRSHATVLLNTVAVNLRDSPPFASVNDPALTVPELAEFDELFESGKAAQAAGDAEGAAARFQAACELDPGHAEAHYRLALCLDQLDQTEEAVEHYRLACSTDALPFRTDERLNEIIRSSAERRGGRDVTLVEASALLGDAGTVGLCGDESFYEHVHFNFDGAYRLGLTWANAAEKALGLNGSNTGTNSWASQAACERRLALTDLNRKLVIQGVLRRFREPPLNGQFNNAARVDHWTGVEQDLCSHETEQTVAEARRVYREAIAERPEDYFLHESYAAFLQATGDLGGAVEEWRRVAQLLPHDFLGWFQLGTLKGMQGDYAEAQKFLRMALARRPELIAGWSELGKDLGATGDNAGAADAFARALHMNPNDPLLLAYRAKALDGAGQTEDAIAAYRRAIELQPGYWKAHLALADLLVRCDRLPEAVAAYKAAIAVKPDHAPAQFNLGVLYLRQDDYEKGIRQFERTLELDPNHQKAREYLPKAKRLLERRSGASPPEPTGSP